MKLNLAAALALSLAFISPVCSQQAVNCRWGPYGDWSECDGCTSTKVRTRHVEVYAQFGGVPCSGDATETQTCVPQKRCPLEAGCGDRFRCTSGQCISQSLVCNGDQDCEDGLDERNCGEDNRLAACDLDKTPPNSDFTGRGYDILTGKLRADVINTRSFGGQCRKVFSGDHKVLYRLPHNILRYNFEVTVDNDESDESYESSWSYVQHIQGNAFLVHDRRTFHKEVTNKKAYRLIILKNKVELAQFQNSAPQYLTLSEGFWKALSSLPLTYDYSAYRQVLQKYGTHYLSEGSLGGEYQALLELDRQALASTSKNICLLSTGSSVNKMPIKVNVFGGDIGLIGALSVLDLENPEANGQVYDNWASSVKDFPEVINQKLRPLYELVKEVQCAGLKKLHLKRAIEEYLAEEHPCHCRPCQNNGQPLLTGSECRCVCRPGTSGRACENGAVIGEQPGVIHGSWSCWSSWGACSGGQRSRTRSCNNPAPSRGGQHCTGLQVEQKPCEDPDIQYLQMMEPQCFSLSVTPPKTCGPPPNLRNGFVQVRDFYLVGNTVEYSCVDWYYLSGNAVETCAENQKWTTGPRVCKSMFCGFFVYRCFLCYQVIPETVQSIFRTLLSRYICFNIWLNPAFCMLSSAPTAPSPPSGLTCKLWETLGKNECVCKMPNQCTTSLQLCATLRGNRNMVLDVCKLGALQCMGQNFVLTSDSNCRWPEKRFTSCEDCQPGTICHESERKCVCKNATECPKDSAPLCVSSGDGRVNVTMTECEAGSRRCAGEQVTVIRIDPCQ
uniref:Complement component C7 n=1 Tax=Oreochromis niloticus TaxID=8128 RepID=A0A669BAE3_ORENI